MPASHPIGHQTTRKVHCQPGDCRWPFNLVQGFVWVSIGGHSLHTLSLLRVLIGRMYKRVHIGKTAHILANLSGSDVIYSRSLDSTHWPQKPLSTS